MGRWRFLVGIFLFFLVTTSFGTDLRKVLRAVQKADYERAVELIQEDLVENPVNPGVRLIYAQILSNDTLQYYDVLEARAYIIQAMADLQNADEDIQEELERYEIAVSDFDMTFDAIRFQLFTQTLAANTQSSMEAFAEMYASYPEADQALAIRDSLAYDSIAAINTWEAYLAYVEAYPSSRFFTQASEAYEALLYADKTAGGQLAQYIDFVDRHKDSPFRSEAISHIFRLRTRLDRIADFEWFATRYPQAKETQLALQVLYHLDPSGSLSIAKRITHAIEDSLLAVYRYDTSQLIPVGDGQHIRYLTSEGELLSAPTFDDFPAPFCGPVQSDVIEVAAGDLRGLMNRSGDLFFVDEILEWRDIGSGFLLISTPNREGVWHKSGKFIAAGSDAGILGGQWIKIKDQQRFALYAFTGTQVTEPVFEEVRKEGEFFVVERRGQSSIYSQQQFEEGVQEGGRFEKEYEFEEIELLNDSLLIGFKGEEECLLNARGEFIIPWGEHVVFPHLTMNYVKSNDAYIIYDETLETFFGEDKFERVLVNDYWIGVKSEQWILLDASGVVLRESIDSLHVLNDEAVILFTEDSLFIQFGSGLLSYIDPETQITNISYRSASGELSTNYIWLKNGGDSRVLDRSGDELFQGEYEEITLVEDSLFRISRNGKQGILTAADVLLLDFRYDFIQYNKGIARLLRQGAITAYDLERNMPIPIDGDADLVKLGSHYIIRTPAGYGLLNSDFEEVYPDTYSAITPFSDSVIFLHADSSIQLVALADEPRVLHKMIDYDVLYGDFGATSSVIRMFTDEGYYLLSSDFGLRTQMPYQEIYRMDMDQDPLYFCRQVLPEAGYQLILIFSRAGTRIFSQAYREGELPDIPCWDDE